MSGDPQRLFESSDVPEELRGDLQRARGDDPAAYDVAVGAATFEAAIADVPAGIDGAEAATAGAGASKSLTWVLVAVIGAATAGAIAWGVVGSGDDAPEHAERVPVSATEPDPAAKPELDPEPQPAAKPELEAEPVPEPAAIAEPEPEPETRPEPAKTAKTKPRPRTSEPDPDRLAAEMRATKAAEAQLRSDPARALTLAREADREFPDGLFGQERQAIVVLALFELGRTAEAATKAKRYLARHPRGSFADKIRAALEKGEG